MAASQTDPEKLLNEAMQAWAASVQSLVESGAKAVRSSEFLASATDLEVAIAETPSDEVFRIDKVTVSRYQPLTEVRTDVPPVLISYGLFGRQTMIDLQEDRSLVRNLLSAGVDVYVVDWGTPTRADQFITLDDIIDDYLRSCVEYLASRNDGKPITMFGICEGGTFSAALAAAQPQLFAGLALAITPIDFKGDPDNFWPGEGFLNSWISNLTEDDIDLLIGTYGMLPGALTGAVFSSLTPVTSMTKYNLGLARMDGNEAAILNFLRMEKWIADRPDHPGAAAREWLNDLYRENHLVKGKFKIAGKAVDLSNIACPVLNIYAKQDHIVPASCTRPLGDFLSDDQYEEIGFPGGHVGVFVSGKAQGVVAGGLVEWMERKLTAAGAKGQPTETSSRSATKKTKTRAKTKTKA
ncbi:MAG: alpha/beta fold hydrolase [Ahrensia sp.]|nr:alpha/beta fold hydrolase [Ahrensia sp.]